MIKIEGLTKSYKDVTAVDNLSLAVEKGELFALLGVNGAGKTTTIKTLCCLCPADSGKAEIGGFDVFGQSAEVKKIIGVSPQETAVAKNLTVYENLVLMGGVHGFSKEKSRQTAEDLIGKFKLDKIRDKQ
ncbi:MAG: ATP-binding cassette domain-containing protein, partial [Oscillospiraceae bacterium]